MGNMARYIVQRHHSPRSVEKYLEQEEKIVYTSSAGKSTKVSPALEWLAAMCSVIPKRDEEMVICY